MVVKLEGANPQVEGAEQLSEKEGAKPTQPQGESTVERTYTAEELRREIDKALGKGLESTNKTFSKQLSQQKQEMEAIKAKSEALETEIEDKRIEAEDRAREHEEALKALDDDTIKKTYIDRVTLAKRERDAAKKEKAANDALLKAETLVFKSGLEKLATSKAKELKQEGYDTEDLEKELESCDNEYEIEIATLKYKASRTPKKPGDVEEDSPKFDSGRSSGKGKGRKPTFEELQASHPYETGKKVASGEWIL